MPLSCRLSHRRISTLQGLHIAIATHNCGISSWSGVHTPCIPLPFTSILDPSPCLARQSLLSPLLPIPHLHPIHIYIEQPRGHDTLMSHPTIYPKPLTFYFDTSQIINLHTLNSTQHFTLPQHTFSTLATKLPY